MSAHVVRILVADDHGVVRSGLRRVLEAEPDFRVCAEAGDGREALEQIVKHLPDIAILDIGMPGLTGMMVLRHLRDEGVDVRTILLSVHTQSEMVQDAVSLGVHGYVVKDAAPSEIVSAVRAILGGGRYFSPVICDRIVDVFRNMPPPRPSIEQLTRRELEVVTGIATGKTAKQIAAELGIAVKTVEAHRTSSMKKLGAHKAADLTRWALKHGLAGDVAGLDRGDCQPFAG